MKDFDVIIVGGGIAGLSAANYLLESDLKVTLLEAENEVGGRVRSFKRDGYTLDRGFQVFLPAYPEAKSLLKYDDLDFQYFLNGAYIVGDGEPFYLVDPLEKPEFLFKTLFDGHTGIGDKLKLFQLRQKLKNKSIDELLISENTSTRKRLLKDKYSLKLISDFFQPFLSGIFLESELTTSSSMFDFVIRMFNESGAALPASGIGAISSQLAGELPIGMIQTGKRVKKIDGGSITLENGDKLTAQCVLLALEGNNELLKSSNSANQDFVGVDCLYFSLDKAPVEEPVLILNADNKMAINNLCFVSRIAPSYAPEDKELLSVTVLKDKKFTSSDIQKELIKIFGNQAEKWEFLEHFDIQYALPKQKNVRNSLNDNEIRLNDTTYIAGDFNRYGSLNAAMQSGREAAFKIMKDLEG
jgi:phytoene dehydrogenase-like protein